MVSSRLPCETTKDRRRVDRASRGIAEFDATALAYDRHRPRYPAALLDDFRAVDGLEPDDWVVEIGAGKVRASR